MTVRRIRYVDMAKGLALVMVILSHTDGAMWAVPFDNFSLAVFFVCAGFTTSAGSLSLRRKFRGLVVPYVTLSAVCLLYSLAVGREVTPQSLAGIAYSRFCLYPGTDAPGQVVLMTLNNSVLWFLTALFSSYVVLRLILLPDSVSRQALMASGSLVVAGMADFLPVLLPWSLDSAFFFAPMMWCGFRMRARDTLACVGLPAASGLFVVYGVLFCITGMTNYSVRDFGDSLILTFAAGVSGSAGLLAVCRWLEQSGRRVPLVEKLNAQALTVFGLQLIFIGLAWRVCVRFVPEDWLALTVVAEVVAACVGGYFAGRVMRRVLPFYR
ncbi:hypothetical protein IMSAGC006_00262 [Muribaculaceae bacterium]|nr:hypothetical protein IMSAGC006_00262 [Muribaculaceae bacterium]